MKWGPSERRSAFRWGPIPLHRALFGSPMSGQRPLSLELSALHDRQLVAAVVIGVFGVACVVAKSAPLILA